MWERKIPVSQSDHKACYGTMFPSVLSAVVDRIVSGKVFSFDIARAGGTFVSHRRVAANTQEWDDCRACPEFEHCYNLCTGKLSLESAIAG
jgi:hypothetical protein